MELEYLTTKKWFYIILLILYFLPPYTSKDYIPQETSNVVFEVLGHFLLPYKHLAPIFHILTIVMILCLLIFKNKFGRIFAAYVGFNYLFIAFAQSTATTEKYGFSVLIGGLICFSIVALFWFYEAIVGKSDFTKPNVSIKNCWMIPLAVLAFWSPPKPTFDLSYLLTSYFGLAFCLTTPVYLAILAFYYPKVNMATMRVTSFMGTLLGVLNFMGVTFTRKIWISIILHSPLLFISAYCLYLSIRCKQNCNTQMQKSLTNNRFAIIQKFK